MALNKPLSEAADALTMLSVGSGNSEENTKALEDLARFKPTYEQEAIINQFLCTKDSFVIRALAGSGKTTILRYLTYLFRNSPENDLAKVVYLAFGKEFALSAIPKFSCFHGQTSVLTTHQFGFSVIRRNEPTVKHVIPDHETRVDRVAELLGFGKPWDKARLRTIASWVRNGICDGSASSIRETADIFGILSLPDRVISAYVRSPEFQVFLKACKDRTLPVRGINLSRFVDFDDMLRPREDYNLGLSHGDLVLIDEFQDLNPTQLELVRRMVMAGARVIAVGDPNQAIFAFRSGVLYDPLDKFSGAYGLDVLPMTISQRASVTGAKLARKLVPDFKHRVGANEGRVFCIEDVRPAALLNFCQDLRALGSISNDSPILVIARANSVLISRALYFLSRGFPFYYRVDIASKLHSVVFDLEKAHDATGENSAQVLIEDWYSQVLMKCEGRENTMSYFSEIRACLCALAESATNRMDCTLDELKQAISKLEAQSKTKGKAPVEFHTVHSAKGMEADYVFLSRADLFPHPMAKKDWERDQEKNILYVAVTRYKRRMVLDAECYSLGKVELVDLEDAKTSNGSGE